MKSFRRRNRMSLRFDPLEGRDCPALLGSLVTAPLAAVTAPAATAAQPIAVGLPGPAATGVSVTPSVALSPPQTDLGIRADTGGLLGTKVTATVGGDNLLSVHAAAAAPAAGVSLTVADPAPEIVTVTAPAGTVAVPALPRAVE